MKRKIKKIVEQSKEIGADYCDIRFEDKKHTKIELKNKEIQTLEEGEDFGFGIRVLVNGNWGTSFSNSLENLEKGLKKSAKIAKTSGKFQKRDFHFRESEPFKGDIESKVKKHPQDFGSDYKIDLLKDAEGEAYSISERVKSAVLKFHEKYGREIFANSEGTFIRKEPVHLYFSSSVTVKEGEELESMNERTATNNGFEWFERKSPKDLVQKATEKALQALKASRPPTGKMPVIIESSLGGLFAHEAVGHAAEADNVFSDNSIFKGKLREKVASEHVNILDNPTLQNKHGSYQVDDEGVKGRKTYIIKDGILNSFLHSCETASRMNQELTGNGRREDYRNVPIPRMSNTYFGNGDWTLEEMLEDIKEGIYVKGFKGGEVRPSEGNFTFKSKLAEVIGDGELKQVVKGPALSGLTFNVLKKIDAVGNDLKIDDPGYCGKGQTVFVDDGSPHLRVKEMVVG